MQHSDLINYLVSKSIELTSLENHSAASCVVKLQPRVLTYVLSWSNRQKGAKVIKLRPLRDVFFYVLEFTRLWPFPWPSFQKSLLVCFFFQKPRVSVKKRAGRGLFCGFLSKIMQTFVSALQIISQMIKYYAGTSLLFVLCPKRCGIYFSPLFCLRKKTYCYPFNTKVYVHTY